MTKRQKNIEKFSHLYSLVPNRRPSKTISQRSFVARDYLPAVGPYSNSQ